MLNHTTKPVEVEAGTKIAQIIFTRVTIPEVRHVPFVVGRYAANRGKDGCGTAGRF